MGLQKEEMDVNERLIALRPHSFSVLIGLWRYHRRHHNSEAARRYRDELRRWRPKLMPFQAVYFDRMIK